MGGIKSSHQIKSSNQVIKSSHQIKSSEEGQQVPAHDNSTRPLSASTGRMRAQINPCCTPSTQNPDYTLTKQTKKTQAAQFQRRQKTQAAQFQRHQKTQAAQLQRHQIITAAQCLIIQNKFSR